MPSASSSDQWRRGLLLCAAGLAGVMAVAAHAHAVVLYATADRNTTAPSVADGLDAWNLQAQWGGYLATPIDPTHFIGAKHVNLASSTITFVYQGNTLSYPVDSSSRREDPYSDLTIYSLQSGYSFPAYAPLYSTAVDGSEIGKTMTVIGRGKQRGSAVTVNGYVAGWQFGPGDGAQSWGQNIVSGFTPYSADAAAETSLLYYTFDSNGVANEAAVSIGDSSGAVFIRSNGQWKLAGITFSIDSPYSYTGTDSGFLADIFDARGLYFSDGTQWVLMPWTWAHPVPGASYASSISQRLGWIEATIPTLFPGDADGNGVVNGADLNTVLSDYNQTGMTWAQGDFNGDGTVNGADLNTVLSNYNRSISLSAAGAAVPEPGALALLGSIAVCLLVGRLSGSRRKRTP